MTTRLMAVIVVGVALLLAGSAAIAQGEPTAEPTQEATQEPTAEPTGQPTPDPTPIVLPWHGYVLLELNPAVFPNGLDAELSSQIAQAFSMAVEPGDWPPYLLQIGPVNVARTAVIVEARWELPPTKSLAVALLAARLGLDPTYVDSAIAFQLFPGDCTLCTWEQSHQAVMEYLAANSTAWEAPSE